MSCEIEMESSEFMDGRENSAAENSGAIVDDVPSRSSGGVDIQRSLSSSNMNSATPPPPPAAALRPLVKVLAGFAAIGGFLFGYDTGVVSGAMIKLKEEFGLSTIWQEMIVSVTIAAAALSSLVGGYLNDWFGRRIVVLIASAVFTAGAVVMAVTHSKELLLVGRLIVGIGVGLSSMTVPMYIAEIAPAHARGRLVTVNNLFITGGQFTAAVIDGAFSYWPWGWRAMLGLGGVPSLIQLIGFLFLPESPRWLIAHGHLNKAKQVLRKTCGNEKYGEQYDEIYEDIERTRRIQRENADGGPTICRMLKSPPVRRALIVGCSLQMFQQLAGINTIMYYSASIIRMSGVEDDSTVIWLSAVVAFVNFIFTLVGVYLVEKVGRRVLTLGSFTGVAVSVMFLAVSFLVIARSSPVISLNSTGECAIDSNCDACILHDNCGFCYQTLNSSIVNSTCLVSDALANQSKTGLCDESHLQGSVLQSVFNCDACILHDNCGFCYQTLNSSIVNGTCLVSDTLANQSKTGLCDESHLLDHQSVWAYDYCPSPYSFLAFMGLILYLMFFAPGMGPMPWTINSEIYPQWARSTGNAVTATVNWSFNLLIAMTFLSLTELITRQGTFFLYFGICVLGIIFLGLSLPETKGTRLEDIQALFSGPLCCGHSSQATGYTRVNDSERHTESTEPLISSIK